MYRHRYYNSSPSWGFLGIVLVILFIVYIICGISDSNTYNHGTCPYCGGTYVYQQAVGHRYYTEYIYICDKCGDLIEVSIKP